MNEIEKLKEQLNSLKEQIEKLEKPQFEVGKWYKFECGIVNYNGADCGYGIWEDVWCNTIWFNGRQKALRQATDKEVEEALIKEAKKRGFKEGVRMKLDFNPIDNKGEYFYFTEGNFNTGVLKNTFCLGSSIILRDGKWAEIVKDEPISIGGYEVKKSVNVYKIGCKNISEKELMCIEDFMQRNKFNFVNFENEDISHKVSFETIQKILKL